MNDFHYKKYCTTDVECRNIDFFSVPQAINAIMINKIIIFIHGTMCCTKMVRGQLHMVLYRASYSSLMNGSAVKRNMLQLSKSELPFLKYFHSAIIIVIHIFYKMESISSLNYMSWNIKLALILHGYILCKHNLMYFVTYCLCNQDSQYDTSSTYEKLVNIKMTDIQRRIFTVSKNDHTIFRHNHHH